MVTLTSFSLLLSRAGWRRARPANGLECAAAIRNGGSPILTTIISICASLMTLVLVWSTGLTQSRLHSSVQFASQMGVVRRPFCDLLPGGLVDRDSEDRPGGGFFPGDCRADDWRRSSGIPTGAFGINLIPLTASRILGTALLLVESSSFKSIENDQKSYCSETMLSQRGIWKFGSSAKLDSLAAELGERVSVLFCGPKLEKVSSEPRDFHIHGDFKNPDSTIHAAVRPGRKLFRWRSRRLWAKARKDFDVGYKLLPSERRSYFSLRPDTLARVASSGSESGGDLLSCGKR